MKIIHTADLHLDSKLETNLDRQKAQKRKKELVLAFENLVTYAKNENVRVVLIAGDMFDHNKVTQSTVETISSIIENAPEIDFLILSGNHDSLNSFEEYSKVPENLKFFSDIWTYYEYDNVTIAGIILNDYNQNIIKSSLSFSEDRFNIATLHTDINKEIKLSELKNKNIDYLALGHLHEFSSGNLDDRGVYAYSGCLESRGFDESGRKGFVLIDTETKEYNFITGQSVRTMHLIRVDISSLTSYREICRAIDNEIEKNGATEKDMIKIVLTGTFTLDTNKDINQLKVYLEQKFFFVKVKDESRMLINAEDYKNLVSLKGEFVRTVLESDISDEQKQKIIELGVRVIEGEEVEI